MCRVHDREPRHPLLQQLEHQRLHHAKRTSELHRSNAAQMEEMEAEISELRAELERTRKEMQEKGNKHKTIAENLQGEIAVLHSDLQAVRATNEIL